MMFYQCGLLQGFSDDCEDNPLVLGTQFCHLIWTQEFSEDTLSPSDNPSSWVLGSIVNLEATKASGGKISVKKIHKPQYSNPLLASGGVAIER